MTVAIAPAKANVGISPHPKNVVTPVIERARVAPSAAPAEVPRKYGSAIGFLSKPWKSTPLAARLAPTNAAAITLGKRISMRIMASMVGSLNENELWESGYVKVATIVFMGNETDPCDIPSNKERSNAVDNRVIVSFCLLRMFNIIWLTFSIQENEWMK